MSRVALIGENSIEYVEELLDIWNRGDCAVLLDWRVPIQTAYEMMLEAGVTRCVIDNSLLKKFKPQEYSKINFVPYENKTKVPTKLPNDLYRKYQANYSKNEAVVIYSSGTTGRSKGIILSHFAISTNADSILDYMNLNQIDCLYIAKSLTHSSTLTGELLVALKSGAGLVIAPTIVPPRYIFNNISRFNVTTMGVNPTLIRLLAEEYERNSYDLSSLKTIYISGSILNDQIYKLAHETFPKQAIYNVYGLSEAGPRVAAQKAACCKNNSVGTAIKSVDIVIVNENGDVVKNGERGVIHVKTPCRYSGCISGEEKHPSLYKGWLNTGDIGYFDECDELHIVGRIDDVIIIDAHKIYPIDVEADIYRLAQVDECIVTTVNFHEENILCCLYSASEKISADIRNKLSGSLMKYEIPKVFVRTDIMPKTPNGKQDTKRIKDIIIKELERNKNGPRRNQD